jgi:hypothetical protein
MLLKKPLTEYNRYQAFAVHMAISLVIFFILLVCITKYWYPGILFDTGNGWKAIGIIIGIDLILGPLLTLIVFNHNKSSLKFDLAAIALVQAAALIYGTWTIHQARPIAIAFINTSFMTIFANSELSNGVEKKVTQFNTIELYYSFDESKSNNLTAEHFKPYSEFALKIKDIKSAYKENDLIQLDPLMSDNKYIRIDLESGGILTFVKKQQL